MSSIDMYLSASQNQATSFISFCERQTQGYEQLQKSLQDFSLNSPILTGVTYQSAKIYFSKVLLPLSQGGILLSEAVAQATKKFPDDYIVQVENHDLKQSELEEKIEQATKIIAQAEEIRKQIIASNMTTSAKNTQLFIVSIIISIYTTIKNKLEEQLRKLLAFHASSPAIFSEITILQQAMSQGLAQTKNNWDTSTNTFILPTEMSWTRTLEEAWKKREEEQARNLLEQELKIELEKIAVLDEDEHIKELKWINLCDLLKKKPEEMTMAEKAALATSYNFITQELGRSLNSIETGIFSKISPIISPILGFEYNEKGDYYYTNKHSIQSYGGFSDLYDKVGFLLGMDLDDEIMYFNVGDKEYRLQLWKGSYGFGGAYGAEIGLYYKNPDSSDWNTQLFNNIDEWYACVDEEDQLKMYQRIYDNNTRELLLENDTRDYAEDGTHFWNLAIKTDPGFSKTDLYTISEIEVPDKEMQEAMYQSLLANKNIEKVTIEGDIITFKWKKTKKLITILGFVLLLGGCTNMKNMNNEFSTKEEAVQYGQQKLKEKYHKDFSYQISSKEQWKEYPTKVTFVGEFYPEKEPDKIVTVFTTSVGEFNDNYAMYDFKSSATNQVEDLLKDSTNISTLQVAIESANTDKEISSDISLKQYLEMVNGHYDINIIINEEQNNEALAASIQSILEKLYEPLQHFDITFTSDGKKELFYYEYNEDKRQLSIEDILEKIARSKRLQEFTE